MKSGNHEIMKSRNEEHVSLMCDHNYIRDQQQTRDDEDQE